MAIVPFDAARFAGHRQRIKELAAGFTAGQKAIVALATIGLVLGGLLFYKGESKPSYGVLFSGLSAQEAGQVTQALQAAHVPFQLADSGSTVEVPESQVDLERVALAQKGIPSGGTVGFSTLDKTGITTSQFVQQVEYQQALEGQLASTIESIEGVQATKVSLAIPQQSPFALSSGPPPTASVLVALAPGASLSASQVQAIVHLTASSVPGLSPSKVTVVDSNGDVLSASGAEASASEQQQQTQAYDNNVSSQIEAMLERVVGAGNAAVLVHATLDFNQVKTTSQSIQTNAKGQPVVAPTQQSTQRQTYTGNGSPPSGILGSGQAPASTGNQNGTYSNLQSQTTNAIGQVTKVTEQAPGSVSSESVAVLLNSSATKGISSSQVASLVRAAAGVPSGAAVSVAVVPFSNSAARQAAAAAKAEAAAKRSAELRRLAEGVGLVALLALLLVLSWRAARKRRPAYEAIDIKELEEAPPAEAVVQAVAEPPTMELPAVPRSRGEGEIDRFIDDSPDEVARLLRSWANERRRPERSLQ